MLFTNTAGPLQHSVQSSASVFAIFAYFTFFLIMCSLKSKEKHDNQSNPTEIWLQCPGSKPLQLHRALKPKGLRGQQKKHSLVCCSFKSRDEVSLSKIYVKCCINYLTNPRHLKMPYYLCILKLTQTFPQQQHLSIKHLPCLHGQHTC